MKDFSTTNKIIREIATSKNEEAFTKNLDDPKKINIFLVQRWLSMDEKILAHTAKNQLYLDGLSQSQSAHLLFYNTPKQKSFNIRYLKKTK